eukprot:5590223-Prorocentrum_lima.AAC.1
MTSSLVGSEMCIRDRAPPSRHGSLEKPRLGPFSPEVVPSSNVQVPPSVACLLYTSDAADDM